MADWEAVREDLARHNQDHLLRFLPELDEGQKSELYADICEADFPRLGGYFAEARQSLSSCQEKKDELLKPLESSICGSTARDTAHIARWEEIGRSRVPAFSAWLHGCLSRAGMEQIGGSKVAVLLLAGGQGLCRPALEL